MPAALELLTSTSRWIVYGALIAIAAVSALALRIWAIERSHRRIRNVLEKRVHQRTRELEQAFTLTEQVVNAVEEAIVVVDAEGRAVLVNPSARQLQGIGDGADDTKEVCRNFARDNSGLIDEFGNVTVEEPGDDLDVGMHSEGKLRHISFLGLLEMPGDFGENARSVLQHLEYWDEAIEVQLPVRH